MNEVCVRSIRKILQRQQQYSVNTLSQCQFFPINTTWTTLIVINVKGGGTYSYRCAKRVCVLKMTDTLSAMDH